MSDVARLGIEVDSSSAARAAVDLDKLPAAARRAERGVEGVGRKATVMGGAVDRATVSVRGMFGAFAAGAAAAFSINAITRTLAGFEQSMAAVQAITRANANEMAALRDIAKDLGATTEFSASQAADGLKFLGMAGFTATESVSAIPSVLNLATAAAMDLASAADITSNIMSGFGIEAENASAVADVLAAASSRANTNVQQLGGAMSTVAPIASALGIDLADTAAAIGVMSDAGIQGERAGTAMRGVLASLAGPTTAAQKALASLGLTVKDVDPATNDLATVMARLRDAGLSTSDAMTIFGREAASGALVLVEAADRVRGFGEELSNVTGEAQRMADTMRDNLGGDIQGLMSSVEAMIIALGESGLTAALRSVTQVATEVFRFLAENMDRVLYYAGAVAAFFAGPYVAAVVAARIQTFSLAAALTTLRGALIRTGVGALVVLFGELVYQIVQAIDRAGGFGQAMQQAGRTANSAMERIQNGARAMDHALRAVALSVEAAFRTAWGNILVGFENMMAAISGSAPNTYGAIDTPGNLQLREGERAGVAAQNARDRAAEYWDLAMNGSGIQNAPGGPSGRGRGGRSGGSATSSLPGVGSGGGGGGAGGGGSAEAQLNAYQEATKAVNDNIAALERQQQAFGLSETAAARFNTAMDLLKGAQEAGIPITAGLIDEINTLADAYATAEEAARLLEEQQQFMGQVQDTIASGFSDLFKGIITGSQSAVDAISGLLGKLGDLFIDRAFQMLFSGGGLMGGGGGLLGGMIIPGILHDGGVAGVNGYGHGRAFPASTWANANRYHNGGIAGLRPNEVPAILERGERVIPANANGTQQAAQPTVIDVRISVDDSGNIVPLVRRISGEGDVRVVKSIEKGLPGMMAEAQMRQG